MRVRFIHFVFALGCGSNAKPQWRPQLDNAHDIEMAIRQSDVSGPEDLIHQLSEPFTKNYVILFDSRSLQAASYRFPRVILYHPENRVILAFNGHPSQRGYDSIEAMRFDEQSKSFEMREYVFSPDEGPRVSEANPERCVSCHSSDPRPLWETASFWPGAYGGKGDMSIRKEHNYGVKEAEGFSDFLQEAKDNKRYDVLFDLERGFSEDVAGRDVFAHNQRFLDFVSALNAPRFARLLRGEAKQDATAHEMERALLCADNKLDSWNSSKGLTAFMRRLGVSINNLFTNFGRDTANLSFEDSAGSFETFFKNWDNAGELGEAFRAELLGDADSASRLSKLCHLLGPANPEVSKVADDSQIQFLARDAMSECVRCHFPQNKDALLDLTDKSSILKNLSSMKQAITAGTMPPDRILRQEERIGLLNFIEASNNPW